MKTYYDKDADLSIIQNKKVAIIGYGSQGKAHALNLQDSGVTELVVALREESPNRAIVSADGLAVKTLEETAVWADVIMMLTPDEVHAEIYINYLKDNMKEGSALLFAHGLSIHFNLIEPRQDLDIIMVAPKGPGHQVRTEYQRNAGIPCLLAVEQNATGTALELGISYAAAIGGGRSAILETSFKNECETDLFGEQSVLCGGLTNLMRCGFETLVEAGYPEEMAYFETVHEVKLVVDLFYHNGLTSMRDTISNTAEFGDYVSGSRIINADTKARMKEVLNNIQNGTFTKDFVDDYQAGRPIIKKARKEWSEHPMEAIGKKLRNMMPWLSNK